MKPIIKSTLAMTMASIILTCANVAHAANLEPTVIHDGDKVKVSSTNINRIITPFHEAGVICSTSDVSITVVDSIVYVRPLSKKSQQIYLYELSTESKTKNAINQSISVQLDSEPIDAVTLVIGTEK